MFEADAFGLVVLEVVVRVALLLHQREPEHHRVVQVVRDGEDRVPASQSRAALAR